MLARILATTWLVSIPAASAAPTFHKDVAPILQAKCQGCHRPGEVAPMSLLTYKDARPWAKAIRQAVATRTMPPWFAAPEHAGKFANDPSLTKAEIDTIMAWVDGGVKEGDPKDAPEPVAYVEGWGIGLPDQVFELPVEYDVPAKGVVEYQHFVVPTGFTEDRWVQRTEVRPGNRAVVHHVLVYVREPGSDYLRDAKPGVPVGKTGTPVLPSEIIAGYAPGVSPAILPQGNAILIKAGSDLVIQMHYTPSGKPSKDRTKLGIVFAKEPPKNRMITVAPHDRAFEIPANASNYRVDAQVTFERPAVLIALDPHMHFRGKSFEYRAVFPDGRTEVLLKVPKYDFNWQLKYGLAKPLEIPAGTRIECTAYFDNSANNPHNPDPTRNVAWGDQTFEEMMIGFMYVLVPAEQGSGGLVREEGAVASEE
jgi:hypothetical protein